jgi:hypothetical protein
MSACSEAFHPLRACAILVVGWRRRLNACSVHGIGTSCFVAKAGGKEYIIQIHNCLLVSQTLQTRCNEITFSADGSWVRVLGPVRGYQF